MGWEMSPKVRNKPPAKICESIKNNLELFAKPPQQYYRARSLIHDFEGVRIVDRIFYKRVKNTYNLY